MTVTVSQLQPTPIEARCPYCEGPLLVQRAAPGDSVLRVVCGDCGVEAEISAAVMQPIRLGPDPRLLAAAG
jgi:hypothetical protein